MKQGIMNPMKIKTPQVIALAAGIFGSCFPTASAEPEEGVSPATLTIGSKAPDLDIQHWYGNTKEPENLPFKEGHVYVVEFWATWCGPCIAGIPHLGDLQEKYADMNVTVIGISDESKKVVGKFINPSGKPGKYAKLTSRYRLASDPDRSTHKDYMEASGESGIPVAYVVGKTGQIEWIGHPQAMDDVLAKVVSGNWNRKAEAKEYGLQQDVAELTEQFDLFIDDGDYESAEEIVNQIRELRDFPEAEETVGFLTRDLKFCQIEDLMKDDPEKGTKELAAFLEEINGNSRSVFFYTLDILEVAKNDRSSVTDGQLKLIADACGNAAAGGGIDAGILFNSSGKAHLLLGNTEDSIEAHKKAVATLRSDKDSNWEWFNDDLNAAIASSKEDGAE